MTDVTVDSQREAIVEYLKNNQGLFTELRSHDCTKLEEYALNPTSWVRKESQHYEQSSGCDISSTSFILKRNFQTNPLLFTSLLEIVAIVEDDGTHILSVAIEAD